MPIKKLQNSIPAAKFRVKYKDIFNLKEFYRALHEWLVEFGWSSVDSLGNIEGQDHWETYYIERTETNGMKEMYWWWRLQKLPIINSYYKFHLDLDFHPLGISDTEVMRDGKKFKVHKGEVEVKVYAYIEFDYRGEWSTHPFLKYFNKIFPSRIFRKELYEHHKLELYREAYTLQAYMKKWFKLKSFLPYEEITPFYPSHAFPKWKKES
ncbi:hypothetical protein GOV06_01020 [Candidatus Woesearchaeota archaeon]|nr:hypothetical protein [Candidatus Woesearchaeota archaeon]